MNGIRPAAENVMTVQRDSGSFTIERHWKEIPQTENALASIRMLKQRTTGVVLGIRENGGDKNVSGDIGRSVQLIETVNGAQLIGVGAVATGLHELPAMPTVIATNIPNTELEKWQGIVGSLDAGKLFHELVKTRISGEQEAAITVSVNGWGESGVACLPYASSYVEGWVKGGVSIPLVHIGVSPYGYAGSVELQNEQLEMQDAVNQIDGAMRGLLQLLGIVSSKMHRGADNLDWVQEIPHLINVTGHSMGGYIAAQLAIDHGKACIAAGKRVRWSFHNPVINGIEVSIEDQEIQKSLLGDEGSDPQHVSLLQHRPYGALVQMAPRLMQVPLIREAATLVDLAGIVKYYIAQAGDESSWYKQAMTDGVLNDWQFIASCNSMLSRARPIVDERNKLYILRELTGKGMVDMAVGSSDRVLTPGPQNAFAKAIGLDLEDVVDTVSHRPTLQQTREMGFMLSKNWKSN